MLKRIFLTVAFVLIVSNSYGAASYVYNPYTGKFDAIPTLTEEDGSPVARTCMTIKFANGDLTDNGDGSCSVSDSGGGGSGDITDVGDCSTGACFTGAGGTGTQLYFKNATSGSITLKPVTGALSTQTISLPAETGTVCTTGSVCSGYQASGSYLTAVTADSPLSGSGTSGSHLVLSTAGTWSGNAGTATTLVATPTVDSLTTTTYLKLPQGSAPTIDAAGKIAVDTTADQLQYYGGAKRSLNYTHTKCMTIESLASTDDDYPAFSFDQTATVTGVWCTCKGTCTTKATFTLENEANTGMTITGTNPTCTAIGTLPSAAAVTANNSMSQYGSAKFSVTNTPTTGDTYQICISYTDNAQ